MYAILSDNNIIIDFENRNIPLDELVHEDFRHLYVPITKQQMDELKIGDVWHPDTQIWESVELPNLGAEIIPAFEVNPYEPTNAEVAQMISDLQADLIIAGVIE